MSVHLSRREATVTVCACFSSHNVSLRWSGHWRTCSDCSLPDSRRQMAILDGNAYDAKCLEAGQERDEDLESCSLLLNNKGTALLQPGASASHSTQHKVVVQLQVRACTPSPQRLQRLLAHRYTA